MTVGKPLKLLLFFAFPILIGNVFQQLYNVVDTAVIGHVLGDDSLAAIGATSAIYNLIIGFANGATNGFSVIIARFFGRKSYEDMSKSVCLTVVLTLGISVVLTAASLLGIRPLLEFLQTPSDIIDAAAEYLIIILVFSVITMLYNMMAAMLRAIGNSTAPLVFLVAATVVNIAADLAFVPSMGISGAAYATVIAQAVSVVLCLIYIVKKCPLLHFKKKYLVMDKYLLSDLSTTALSMGLMYAIVSVGSVALQRAVNSFGSTTIAAHTAARKLDDIFMLPLGTISMAASTFASQNYGAGKYDRVKKGIITSILLAFVWSAISIVLVFVGSDFMVSALTGSNEKELLETAAFYIKINIPFFFMLSLLLVLRSSLQGIGRKIVPLCASAVELVGKFAAVGFIAPTLGYFGVCIIEPIIWTVCMFLVGVDFIVFIKKSKKMPQN